MNRFYFHIRMIALMAALFYCLPGSSQEIKSVKITDLEKMIRESKTPVIVNFWATWCRPCIEEIPYFQKWVGKHEKDSLELWLVSVDFKEEFPSGIRGMAAKRKFSAPVFWLNETNADYFCPRIDPKWSGSVPASLFINNRAGYRKFFEEQLTEEELKIQIMALLQMH